MNPFHIINDISYKKQGLLNEDNENEYSAFMINRGLSQFQDCVLLANEMNMNSHLDARLQHDFLFHAIRSRKRFSKWAKKVVPDKIEVIKEYYGYSDAKAESVADLISDNDINHMKSVLSKGGKTK